MKIGYFCYLLSGTGPRTRAADIISGVASRTDHEVVVLTDQPEKVRGPATVETVALKQPLDALATARRAFADADIVHVPINTYQVLFVRLVYGGPLVAGVGPGLQPELLHRYFGLLLGIDTKIKVHEGDRRWDELGYDTAVCTATIDTEEFRPYDDDRVRQLRRQHGVDDGETVVLYVGKLSEEQGAHVVDEMARLARDDDDLAFIVAGDGPMSKTLRDRSDLTYEGFVDNERMPEYYNVADVTVAPRKNDNTSNVGLESIACGTPMVTTASGDIVDLFRDRGTYVWADRSAEAVLAAVRELAGDPEYYAAQRDRGLRTIDEMELTIEDAIDTHLDVYADATRE